MKPMPAKPRSIIAHVEGSGTAPMLFVSKVTAPFLARALPSKIVAPVVRVMLVSARMFPSNAVWVPRVAELPTCQKTLLSPPFIKSTDELLAVVSVLPIWKRKSALGSPWVLRVSVPVNCAESLN